MTSAGTLFSHGLLDICELQKMQLSNPFNISYLTEASLTPGQLMERYSFLPFLHLQKRISDTTNVMLLGRKGVGKTMLLKLFDPDLMRLLYESNVQEAQQV